MFRVLGRKLLVLWNLDWRGKEIIEVRMSGLNFIIVSVFNCKVIRVCIIRNGRKWTDLISILGLIGFDGY